MAAQSVATSEPQSRPSHNTTTTSTTSHPTPSLTSSPPSSHVSLVDSTPVSSSSDLQDSSPPSAIPTTTTATATASTTPTTAPTTSTTESRTPPTSPQSQDNVTDSADATLSAEKARVQSLINRLVSRAHNPPVDTPSSPTATSGPQSRNIVPLDFTESPTAISLSLRVSADTRATHVFVGFAPHNLNLSILPPCPRDSLRIRRPLLHSVAVDSCWWALEDHADGSRVLLVELEKSTPTTWGGVFKGGDDAVVEALLTDEEIAEEEAKIQREKLSKKGKASFAKSYTPTSIPIPTSTPTPTSTSSNTSLEATVGQFVSEICQASATAVDTTGPSDNSDPSTVVEDVNDEEHEINIASKSAPSNSTSRTPESGSSSKAEGTSDRKVLTRADLPKMVAQHRAAVAARGPGWAEAAVQLGTLHHYGIGVNRNISEAARLYRLGLEAGAKDSSAAFQLGLICNQGEGEDLRPDAEQAVRWWTEAARMGNSVAMFNLGVMCMNGSGCEMDPVAAMRWFEQARAINPGLDTPRLTPAQLEQRVAAARRERKERRWAALSDEEREWRRAEALSKLRVAATATVGAAAVAIGMIAVHHWWRNRL